MSESRRVLAYVGVSGLLAIAALLLVLRIAPLSRYPQTMLILICLSVVGTQAMVQRLMSGVDLSVNFIIQLAAIGLVGPSAAMLVGGIPALLDLRRTSWIVRLFNAVLQVLSVGAAATVFVALGGAWGRRGSGDVGSIVLNLALPLLGASIVMFACSSMLLAGIISLDKKVPYREVLSGIVRGVGVPFVGYGLFGLLLVVLWNAAGVGPLAAILVLAPLFVARWAFAQYAAQHAAHERTVAALVGAVEAKDRYTRGHSERVAEASMLIGRTVGLSQQRTSTLHFAGMLHDVGKLGVPTRVLQKTGALTDEEFEAVARHPVRGLEMVREIEFLGEALQGILHHHERMDGRGYPMGLAGSAIPEFARIIAVADAFDAMTSTRSYRQARDVAVAMHELEACVGPQFDGRFVEALHQALEHRNWEPVTGGSGQALPASSAPADCAAHLDHDDPQFFRGLDDDLGASARVGRGENDPL